MVSLYPRTVYLVRNDSSVVVGSVHSHPHPNSERVEFRERFSEHQCVANRCDFVKDESRIDCQSYKYTKRQKS